MAAVTIPVWTVIDDSGNIVTGATVTITSVKDKAGVDIASHGAVVNAVDGSNVLTGANISVDYDAETKGEAWIVLAISKGGSTFTGLNAAPAFFAAKDSGRILIALPNAAPAASNGLPTVGTSTGQINPDSGKVPATLAPADVSGNLPADIQTIATHAVTAAAGVTFPASVASQTVAPSWSSTLPIAASGTVKNTSPRTAHSFVVENQTGSRLASRWNLFLATHPGLPLRVASIADSGADWLVTMTDDLPVTPSVGATVSIVGFADAAPLTAAATAAAILVNPSNKLATDSSGRVALDPSAALTDSKAATWGGALAGAWALAWGKARTNAFTGKLEIWGPGNATGTPSATFTVDSVANPTIRTLD